MTYYDEQGQVIENPDLDKGYIYIQRIKVGSDRVLMAGTEGMGIDGKGLYKLEDVYEERSIYHPYSEEELAAMTQPTDETIEELSLEDRISALEEALLMVMSEEE